MAKQGVNPITGKRYAWEAEQEAKKADVVAVAELEKQIQLLERQKAIQEARRKFMPFIKFTSPDPDHPNDVSKSRYQNAPHHDALADALERVVDGEIPFLIITMPPRHGKECADSTPVLTPGGWTTHGQLKVGDHVFGPDGRPTKVIWVAEPNLEKVRVEFTNGDSVVCHPNHEWTVYDRAKARWVTKETRELMRRTLRSGPEERGGRYVIQLPDTPLVHFEEQRLPLDPYALGVWLGDGTTSTGVLNMASDDACVWARVAKGLGGCQYVAKPGVQGPLTAKLDAVGVLHRKHIPEVYLRASAKQRMELLAGLMDTDGHVEAKTGRCRIVTTNEDIRDGLVDLCTTLGFRPYVTAQDATESSSGVQGRRTEYTVGFQPTETLPTSTPRRNVRKFAVRRRVAIKAITAASNEPGRCIQVDRPDGLYLVGRSLMVTHNSEQVSRRLPAWFMGRFPELNGIVGTYNDDFASDFGKEVRDIVKSPQYRQVFPETRLQRGGSASDRLKTTKGGQWSFVGRGGSLTGRGGHCFVSGTMVLTKDTRVQIQHLKVGDEVLSYDGKSFCAKRVQAISARSGARVFRITTATGRVVEATGDHPFYSGGAWVEAAKLTPGDPLVRAVRVHGVLRSTSHRREPPEQQSCQPDISMPTVSYEGSFLRAEEDTVRSVEDTGRTATVYDIQVEGTHCFFAEDLLVHNCLILDDLIKDDKEAQSQAIRDQAWNWFTKVAMTRRMGKKLVIMTFTRWHSDDPIGRLTDPENEHYNHKLAKRLKIINLPAIAEEDDPLNRKPGEPLWPDGPDKFDLDYLEEQQSLDPLGFAAMYQGRPSVMDGVLFRRENVRYYRSDQLPDSLHIYCSSDHAVGTSQRNDPTVLLKVGIDHQSNIYLLDCIWKKMPTDEAVEAMLVMAGGNTAPLLWWAERGHISKSIGPFLRKRMVETGQYINLIEVTPAADKTTRAQPIAARFAMGKVLFPRDAPWTEKAINQLMGFPNVTHDDFVDALAYIGLGLQKQVRAPGPSTEQKEPAYGTLAWVKFHDTWKKQQNARQSRGGF